MPPPTPVPAHSRPRWLIPVIVGGSALVITAIVATIMVFTLSTSGELAPSPAPATSQEQDAPEATDPGGGTHDESADGEITFGPDAPVLDGTGPIGDRLETLATQYRTMYDDGSLWDLIPQTTENEGAYFAFQLLLADMRGATLFGVSQEDELYFSQYAKYLEERFRAEQPLGASVTFTGEDGHTFKYDGDTGAVSRE